ncbi:hypothetical protein [Flavobacterium foetidum]|uniref:hypothetical protein n=1 Tax=Flavobacterium foetidum TaxID=2026681 RepID=UPI0010755AC1|nr:hypothetical protein [Flavobacterium foetidum]KAF2515284.1 hypothetical protein E0W73_10130 [Flavobacterium foetidum]
MDNFKGILFFAAIFTFLVSLAMTGSQLTFYFKNKEMFDNPRQYSKEYVVIDSTFTETQGSKNKKVFYYGLSKKFDNYKTVFDLNVPDGSALLEDEIIVEPVKDPLNDTIVHYYAWVNKQKHIGYIANSYEQSIQENWIFSDRIYNIKLNIGFLVFSLVIFFWLKVYKIFQK